MNRSLVAVLVGTFTLRVSTGLTGTLLLYYFADLPKRGGPDVGALAVGVFGAAFFASELLFSTPFGVLSDRYGHHRIMQIGPVLGLVAVILTYLTTHLFTAGLVALGYVIILVTRLLEGGSGAASVPSILGYIAQVTADDELLRGRASARFEGATVAGLGVGLVLAGLIYAGIKPAGVPGLGPVAFLANAIIYTISFVIYRRGVDDPRADEVSPATGGVAGLARYREVLLSSHVWLLAPTWIAVNAAIGIWSSQSLFQLVQTRDPRFADQYLMGRVDPLQVSIGLAAGLVVFFAGLAFWGERFKRIRRTTIILYGIGGGTAIVLATLLINHSEPWPSVVRLVPGVVVVAGVFVLAGATPAALGLLADMSERHPSDRGAIMGLYSVFLGLGQIIGSLLGGATGQVAGIDGILVGTLFLLAIALLPLSRLRRFEHVVEGGAEGQVELT
ncbi:MAG TPA: MFS transporter [Candidatus Dormibacteraeota bacterium]|nr:MFS transporter [Candidatus Dormibacteraeota bacterium]